MVRCGDDETVRKGPSGQDCQRMAGHRSPHCCAGPGYRYSILWMNDGAFEYLNYSPELA